MAITLQVSFSVALASRPYVILAKYKTKEPITLPDGKTVSTITALGNHLPDNRGAWYEFTGNFLPHGSSKGKKEYVFKVENFTELLPTNSDAIPAYLATLKGIGKVTAEKIYLAFGEDSFSIIENEPEKLLQIQGISKEKAAKIQTSYISRQGGRQLYIYLYAYGIKDKTILKIYKHFGEDALSIIQKNPYSILDAVQIGFKTVDGIAKNAGLHIDNPDRIRAGIVEVLRQGEVGGELFSGNAYPNFMLDRYLRAPILKLLAEESTNTTGGTYLPREILYIKVLKLLQIKVSEEDFNRYLFELHNQKKIFLAIDHTLPDDDIDKIKVYRRITAIVEYKTARKLLSLKDTKLPHCEDLIKVITDKEKETGILLSKEQRQAVIQALSSSVSIVTGGPGTGKTSILKIILAVFKYYFPQEDVLLLAPTGRAAKRMSEQTGYPAKTIHKALNVYADDEGNMVETNKLMMFREKLIIVDETSMMGMLLLNALLSHINSGTRIVFVGDVDQLPSIEIGAVLREMIESATLPTTKLTKTFRQACGSSIITNASRIKIGEDHLDYDRDFLLVPCRTSEEISQKVAALIPKVVAQYGENDVLCLTAYRHNTASGSKALNERLKKILNPSTMSDLFVKANGTLLYEGDKVMYTKNTDRLANGDIGKITKIFYTKSSCIVTCDFDGVSIPFEDDEINSLEPAWAMTIHKSQGSEAKCVVLIADIAHKNMLKRNLLYTGVSRAKQCLIIVGQRSALDLAIKTQDSVYRKSGLGMILKEGKKEKECVKTETQLSFL